MARCIKYKRRRHPQQGNCYNYRVQFNECRENHSNVLGDDDNERVLPSIIVISLLRKYCFIFRLFVKIVTLDDVIGNAIPSLRPQFLRFPNKVIKMSINIGVSSYIPGGPIFFVVILVSSCQPPRLILIRQGMTNTCILSRTI